MNNHKCISDSAMIRQYRRKSFNLPDGTTIKRIEQKVIDVFTGIGWTNFSRYRNVKGRWLLIDGKELPNNVLKSVIGVLN